MSKTSLMKSLKKYAVLASPFHRWIFYAVFWKGTKRPLNLLYPCDAVDCAPIECSDRLPLSQHHPSQNYRRVFGGEKTQMPFLKRKFLTQACLDIFIILQSGRESILQTLLLEQWGSGARFLPHCVFLSRWALTKFSFQNLIFSSGIKALINFSKRIISFPYLLKSLFKAFKEWFWSHIYDIEEISM